MTTTIALITGANRGLGLEAARQLGRAGLTVLVGARDPEAGNRVAATLREEGLAAEAVTLDVTDGTSVAAAAAAVRDRHGVLDVLVNNAGILPEATTDQPLDAEAVAATLDTNVTGAVRVTQHLLPLLRESGRGRIVNVSSTMGSLADQSDPDSPFAGMVVPGYQASKAALNSVTIGLSKLLADTPVKVNSVCPGFVQTELTPVNHDQAPLTAADAARVVVRYALLDDAGPTGGFFDAEAAVAW